MLQVGIPLLVVTLLVIWLPGWMRPSVVRARIRTARVTAGPVEAVIMASGTVSPEVERVLSSPLDARVLRLLQRPGAHLKKGDPVVELDVSESVLALEKVVKDLKIKDNQQAQTRLTLEKSLLDLDGRLEVKALELQSAQSQLQGDEQLFKEGLFSREALRRSELAVKQAQIELGAAPRRTEERREGDHACSSKASRSSAAPSTRKRRRRAASSTSRRRSRIATAC